MRTRLELMLCQPLSVCFIAGFSAQMLEAFLMNPIFVMRYAAGQSVVSEALSTDAEAS
jgi:hypothetical protein